MATPIAQYLFKDNVQDSKGAYHGTAYNITYENVPNDKNFGGKVAVFNGVNAYADFGNVFNFTNEDFTYELWLKITNATANSTIFSKTKVESGYPGFSLWFPESINQLRFSIIMGDTSTYKVMDIPAQTSYADWQHIAIVKSGINFKAYCNGVQKGSRDFYHLGINNTSFKIAKFNDNGGLELNGKLANFRVYNSALSVSEILQHYQKESTKRNSLYWQKRKMLMAAM